MIPKLIHFIWIGDAPLPEFAQRNIAEFRALNPDYEVMMHGEGALHPAYRAIYDSCTGLDQKSDLIRYSVLEQRGGWYFDCDFWPMRPLSEAVNAWGMDGSKMIISRQHGHLSGDALPYGNAPLCCAPGHPVLAALRAKILATVHGAHRTAYGPDLMTWLVENHRAKVCVMDWPWWFPSSIADAPYDYAQALAGNRDWLRIMCQQTGGQLPYAMHLWATGKTQLRGAGTRGRKALLLVHPSGVEMAAFRQPCEPWPCGHPIAAARDGLQAAGYEVLIQRNVADAPRFVSGGPVDVAIAWNGLREPLSVSVGRLHNAGIPVLRMEHGFWTRRENVQLDHAGFLHRASWARQWPAVTEEARARFAQSWPFGEIVPMNRTRQGDILILGQVSGDTQMLDSVMDGPAPLERYVFRAVTQGTPVRFRPHPGALAADISQRKAGRALFPRDEGPLTESLASAKFAVTINSNAIVECLAAGVPVLAFGPSTGIYAGVVKQATLPTLAKDIDAMQHGWIPDTAAVERYLMNLAARQYHCNELRTAAFWQRKLTELGVWKN